MPRTSLNSPISGEGVWDTESYRRYSEAQAALLSQTQALQQSESGVNLDEEAASLLRYQQAYQAASKVIQTANEMFDALLEVTR